uniref:Predicted protein n=1 Tax=Physcomitrium patens TaxID=3218 RepID=A9U5J0_PHYPA
MELLTKRERRKDRSNIPKIVQVPKVPVHTTRPTMLTIQPSTSLSKKADMGMEEIIRGMRDLQIKLARLEENTSTNNSKNVSKQEYVQRCFWCDDASHTRKDCNEFNNMIWEDLLRTNFGKGGMRALVQDYLKEYETAARESASYGARVDDDLGGSTKTRVLEERILNAKVEFTLKEVLEITKKEFHDVIIDSIKRKRQLMGETGMSHAIDARIYKDEEEVDIGYKQPTNEKNGYNQRVRFEDYSDKEMKTLSHYIQKHWARASIEVLVKVGDIKESIVTLVDHGFEINLMSKDFYKKQKWPIDMEHG